MARRLRILFNTETELPMSVELPDKVVMKVTYTETGVQGRYCNTHFKTG